MSADADSAYYENARHLKELSTEEAIGCIERNDFHEAPNWGNVTTKQVLVDLYRRIAELEKK